MIQQIAQVLVFLVIALPFAYMAYDVAREISKALTKLAGTKLIAIENEEVKKIK